MAVCVCVSVCSIVSDSVPEQVHMGVCVCVCACVLSCVQLFAPEQWHTGVCVCVCGQSCPTLCIGAVAYGCVCVYAHACMSYLTVLEQWHLVVCVCMYACSVMSDFLH